MALKFAAGMGVLLGILIGMLARPAHAAEGPYRLRISTSGIQMDRVSGKQADPLLKSIRYAAYSTHGLAFETVGINERKAVAGSTQLKFALEGPDAAQASVTAVITPQAGSIRTIWTVRDTAPAQAMDSSRTGFQMQYAQPIRSADTRPATRFVRPTGERPYEVRGDTPYRDLEWQLRQVTFAKSRLIIATRWYDPDWIYHRQISRAPAFPAALPKGSPAEATYELSFVPQPAIGPDISAPSTAADMAAAASSRPVSLSVQCPQLTHLFVPGETARFALRLHNVTPTPQTSRVSWAVWDYNGRKVAHGRTDVVLGSSGTRQIAVAIPSIPRGILFLDASLVTSGAEWLERTTFGVLPKAPSRVPNPRSPFGLAGITCSPDLYPDQKTPDEVLAAAHRIGARWVRIGVPLGGQAENPSQRLLAHYGLSGHFQVHTGLPAPGHAGEFGEQLEITLRRLRGQPAPIEFGNELNLAGVSPQDYVDSLLRPVHDLMRTMLPGSRILSMGLGGVDKKWLDGFVAAGGMDLVDVLSVHPGCQPRAPEYWKGFRGWVFRPQVQDALQAAGRKDVWLSETYSPTPPDRTQLDVRTAADYLVRTYLVSLALGVKVVEWYQLQDGVWFAQRPNPADTEYNYGLLYSDLTPKPGYIAYAAMTEQMEGLRCLGRLNLGADDLYGLHFRGGRKEVTVLWSYREAHETDLEWWPPEKFRDKSRRPGEPWVSRWKQPVVVRLPASRPVTVTDLMGNSHTLRPKAGVVSLSLTGSPIYVHSLGDLPVRPSLW